MTGARRRALFLVMVALAAAALTIALVRRDPSSLPARPIAERPALMLLTSLPLLFGEDFSLTGGGSPALTNLQERYKVVPISVTGTADLAQGRLLLMAQPPAQTAENLVMLDRWVRDGGRVMLLADPMLEWPSKRPLGDPLRPAAMFADTGLLAHWKLTLDAPDQRGSVKRRLGRFPVAAVSPGTLHGGCAISRDAFIAHCSIGRGEVTVFADADLLNVTGLGAEAEHNLDGMSDELARLEQK
jgi:hypothetical protein